MRLLICIHIICRESYKKRVVLCVWFTISMSPFCNWVNVALIHLRELNITVTVAVAFGMKKEKKKETVELQFVII